ncbi:MAG TPA: lysine--tRNA ligase [Alphaproteobacteria bacterium]|nr:lysine--tRNA ligase [Alphaproteobacteria bacterium]
MLEFAAKSNLWVWKEALKLKQKFEKNPPKKGFVLFETGYGPSGLPHIGTFGEVFRTTMVRQAFEKISDIPTKLICFSDDMDGLRKVPENLPNKEMLEANLGKPLTAIPDPFGTAESFGAHMNGRLKNFLDKFGFDYEFMSATEQYKSGAFDKTLLIALKKYDDIMKIMLPTLGEERQKTYSPFLPISPKTGRVLYVPMKSVNSDKGTITYISDEDGQEYELPVGGGNCKMQWKPDFGMRWAALEVDFEMYGKDHLVNEKIYSAICKTLGGTIPEQFNFELFLDEKGEKISKSKGNGISIEQWLEYGTQESLALFMFNSPQKAKKLHFDVIPQHIDDYIKFSENAQKETEDKLIDNPFWHINNGEIENLNLPVSFALLVNLASACNPDNKDILWSFITRYADGVTKEKSPYLDKLAELAVKYYYDFVKPTKQYHTPNEAEKKAVLDVRAKIETLPDSLTADEIQTQIFEIGKQNGYEQNLRDWFSLLYKVLLGQASGPRMGSFIKLYGIKETIALINEKLG